MTKGELLRMLEPFTDELCIELADASGRTHFALDGCRYSLDRGEGVVALTPGAVTWVEAARATE